MKVKVSLILFVPVLIAAVGLKLASVFALDGNGMFMGMNAIEINYAVIGITLGFFLLCVLVNLIDRKTAPVYPVKKNPIAGAFAVLAGVSVAASAITTLINTSPNTEYYLMAIVCAGFSVFAALAFFLMSKIHFTGKTVVSGVSMFFIFPALWGCSELVSEFLVATKTSISASDMTPLFSYIFITLYYFSYSMIISRIKGRNPVKACFIYGLPAAVISFAYGAHIIFTAFVEGVAASRILLGTQFVVFAIYAISFITEMAFNSYTKDEIEIIDGMPVDNDTYENSYVKSGGYDELVFSEKDGNATIDPDSEEHDEIPSMAGLDDFVIGYGSEEDNEPIPYFTKEEMKKPVNSRMVFYDKNTDLSDDKKNNAAEEAQDNVIAEEISLAKNTADEEDEAPKDEPVKEMSEIDLLLQELENKK